MYKRYEKYKDSGVEWIGEIPDGWEAIKLNYLKNKSFMYGANEAPDDYDPELPRYIRITDIDSDGNLRDDTKRSLTFRKAISFLLKPGDLLFARSGATVGKTFIYSNTDSLACFAGYLIKFSANIKKLNPYYLYYYTQSNSYSHWVLINTIQATIQNVSAEKYGNLYIPVPHIVEQKDVVDYLDYKTTEIGSLIADKEELIKRLEEYKQSIITEAVTKGLNQDVKMKDSGLEWIGEIPEHWKHIKVKRIVSTPITDGPHETPVLVDKGIPFVSAEAIKNNKVDFDYVRGFISEDEHIRFSKKCKPQLDDIFIVKSGATTGKIALVETDLEFSIWSPLALVRCETSIAHYKFIFYYLQSIVFQRQIQLYWNYGTQQNIGMATLENLYVTLPSLEEQNNITAYLDRILCELEGVIITVQSHINKLNSYRQSLIYEAVTGKIDVRDYQFERSEQLA